MLPMKLNLAKMKKVSGDESSSTFQHPNGHKITIAHKSLPALQRKQLERLPVHLDEGGDTWRDKLNAASDKASNAGQTIADESVKNEVPADTSPPLADRMRNWSNEVSDSVNGKPKEMSGPPQFTGPIAPALSVAPIEPKEEDDNLTAGAALNDKTPTSAAAPASSPDISGNPIPGDAASAYNLGVKAAREQQDISSQTAKANYEAGQQDLQDRQKLMADAAANQENYKKNHDLFMQDFANNHINTNHYMEHMGTGQKVATAIGLLLGGFHSGSTGQADPAQKWLDEQINRDIDAQKNRQEQGKTLIGANQQNFKDIQMANNETRMQMNDIYAHKIQQQANAMGTQQAAQAANAYISKLGLENQGILQTQALRGAALQAAGNGTAKPEVLIPYLVPAEHQKDAVKEVGQATAALKNHDDLMRHFDDAAKENTILRTAGGLRTPAAISAMAALELPMIHDQEGRVSEFEGKTLNDLHPKIGDIASKVAEKRKAYEEFILGKQQTPTLNTYAPQLAAKFHVAPSSQSVAAPQVQTMNGLQYQRVAGGWKKVK